MERGPVPPHERTWRHPSELAAQERLELRAVVAPRTTRVTALAAGTFGLIVVAALVLVVTPSNQRAPIAMSATTISFSDLQGELSAGLSSPSSPGLVVSGADRLSSAMGITGSTETEQPSVATSPATSPASTTTTVTTVTTSETGATVTTLTTIAAIVTNGPAITSTTLAALLAALATPVGDGRFALVTTKSIGGRTSGTVSFRLRSGDTAIGEIVYELNDTVVVALPTVYTPHAIATQPPGDADMVTVMSDTPVDMIFGDVAHADVPEGTPVLDGAGGLVGLCTTGDDGTTVVIDVAEVGDGLSEMPADTMVLPSDVPITTAPLLPHQG